MANPEDISIELAEAIAAYSQENQEVIDTLLAIAIENNLTTPTALALLIGWSVEDHTPDKSREILARFRQSAFKKVEAFLEEKKALATKIAELRTIGGQRWGNTNSDIVSIFVSTEGKSLLETAQEMAAQLQAITGREVTVVTNVINEKHREIYLKEPVAKVTKTVTFDIESLDDESLKFSGTPTGETVSGNETYHIYRLISIRLYLNQEQATEDYQAFKHRAENPDYGP